MIMIVVQVKMISIITMIIIIINYKYQAWKEEGQEEQGGERGAEERQVECEDDQGGGQGD